MPDVQTSIAQHFRRTADHLRYQVVRSFEGLADHAAADDARIAAGQFKNRAISPVCDRRADVALDGRPAGQGLQAAQVSATAFRPAYLHDHVSDFPGRLPPAAPKLAPQHQSATDAGAHANVKRAFRFPRRAQPGLAQRAQVSIIAQRNRRLKSLLQTRSQRNAA